MDGNGSASSWPKVLVVEDDTDTRQLYMTALGFAGFRPMSAEDGLEALHVIDTEPISLVVLDLNLPRIDGRSVLRELQENSRTAHIPVIVVTGQEVDQAELHAAAVLSKPCGPGRLLDAVEYQLDGV